MTMNKTIKWGAGLALVVGLGACGDILTVSDPQRYTSEDLDNALPAVANGVEGAVHETMDTWVVYQSLMADVYEHTGTWQGYDEIDHGRFIYGAVDMDGVMNSLLRARWFADSAEERFVSVLGDAEAAKSEYTAQARLGGAFADLVMGMTFCEAPAVADGPAVSDKEILAQAITKFTATISTAQAAGKADIAMAALAGRARAKLVAGDYAGAAADAKGVPTSFVYSAKFNNQSANWIVTVTTATFNEAAGLRRKWWPLIDLSASGPTFMKDPYTMELDPRKPVHWDGDRATDNITPHYSQWKFKVETDDIAMVRGQEMRLIEAEALMRTNNYGGAMLIINAGRTAVGLTPLAVPTDANAMRDILLSEREAELFMEGMRAVDLYRFGIVKDVFAAMNDPERPAAGRPTKFSMSDTEALYNNNIADDLGQRCLPRAN
jgi:hypothetical protein